MLASVHLKPTMPLNPFTSNSPGTSNKSTKLNQRSGLEVSPVVLKNFVQDVVKLTNRAVEALDQQLDAARIKRGLHQAAHVYLQKDNLSENNLLQVNKVRLVSPEMSLVRVANLSFHTLMNLMAQKAGVLQKVNPGFYELNDSGILDLNWYNTPGMNLRGEMIQNNVRAFMNDHRFLKILEEQRNTSPAARMNLIDKSRIKRHSFLKGVDVPQSINLVGNAEEIKRPLTEKEEKIVENKQHATEACRRFLRSQGLQP